MLHNLLNKKFSSLAQISSALSSTKNTSLVKTVTNKIKNYENRILNNFSHSNLTGTSEGIHFQPAIHHIHSAFEKEKSNKTTGWTEKTRNQFHPGDIITALRLDYIGYSPSNALGLTELASHRNEGREFCQSHITEDGSVMGFAFEVLPRAEMIASDLRKEFPAIAEFSDSLSKRNLKEIFASEDKIKDLIREIEQKFGKKIEVLPSKKTKLEVVEKITEIQLEMLMFGDRSKNNCSQEISECKPSASYKKS